MTFLRKMPIVFALSVGIAPFASPAAFAGHCTHKVILTYHDRDDPLRISLLLKTSGEELTAFTGKKDENEVKVKVGSNYNNYTSAPEKLINADPDYVGTNYDKYRAARRVAVLDVQRGTIKGFKLYVYLHHPDGRKALCTIDADQTVNKVEGTINTTLSRLKCSGTTAESKMQINSCDSIEIMNNSRPHVMYWADVDFVK